MENCLLSKTNDLSGLFKRAGREGTLPLLSFLNLLFAKRVAVGRF